MDKMSFSDYGRDVSIFGKSIDLNADVCDCFAWYEYIANAQDLWE